MMKDFFLSTFSSLINAYLELGLGPKGPLQKLSGHIITIELLPFHFIFQCCFNEKGANLHADEPFRADAKITGTPLQMLNILASKGRRHFFMKGFSIEGDVELGQQVVHLLDEVQIDWEEQLAHLIGEVPAFQIGNMARHVRQWTRDVEEKLTQDINEYIHEEAQWLPSREALQDLFNEIDQLRMDVDRLEAKIQHLQIIGLSKIDDEGAQ